LVTLNDGSVWRDTPDGDVALVSPPDSIRALWSFSGTGRELADLVSREQAA
jgi:hypothetical protein